MTRKPSSIAAAVWPFCDSASIHRRRHAQRAAGHVLITQQIECGGVVFGLLGGGGSDRLRPGGLEIVELERAGELDQFVRQLRDRDSSEGAEKGGGTILSAFGRYQRGLTPLAAAGTAARRGPLLGQPSDQRIDVGRRARFVVSRQRHLVEHLV